MLTQEQFDQMKYEILECRPSRYDMLADIVFDCLKKHVERWCKGNPFLKGRQEEYDILQSTVVRLMQRVVTGFLNNESRYIEEGNVLKRFVGWMKVVAHNIYADKVEEIRGSEEFTLESYEEMIKDHWRDIGEEDAYKVEGENIYKLKKAIECIISGEAKVYKIIAWLSIYVFMLAHDLSKIEANRYIEHELADFTLYELYELINEAADRIKWLEFTEAQKEKICTDLKEYYDRETKYGDMKLREFFMKKGGKGTLSDWWNKMSKKIKNGGDDDDKDRK